MIQQAFGDQSLSRTQVFQWHARFKTGRTSVDDDDHIGRPTSCTTPGTVERIQELVRRDRRRTIRDIAEEVGVSYGTCQRVLSKKLSKGKRSTRHSSGCSSPSSSKREESHRRNERGKYSRSRSSSLAPSKKRSFSSSRSTQSIKRERPFGKMSGHSRYN